MSAQQSKYGHMLNTAKRQWQDEHDCRISDHALERWDSRTPNGSVAPETALETCWELGTGCKHLREKFKCEHLWVYESSWLGIADRDHGVVFLAEQQGGEYVVTTVYTYPMLEPPVQAYVGTVWKMRVDGEYPWSTETV